MLLLHAPNSLHLHQWPRQFAELIPVDSLMWMTREHKHKGCGGYSG
jgi:hypothetical protein